MIHNKAIVEMWFPTLIYSCNVNEIIGPEDNEKFYKKALEYKENIPQISDWRCDTYNTIGTVNLHTVDLFKPLVELCKIHVLAFSKQFGVVSEQITCRESWINVAAPGDYQEYHIHADRHFSLVYYVKTPKDCGNIVFKSQDAVFDMLTLPTSGLVPGNMKSAYYTPVESNILIFRSNIIHMAEKNKSNEDRVSISMNFTIEA